MWWSQATETSSRRFCMSKKKKNYLVEQWPLTHLKLTALSRKGCTYISYKTSFRVNSNHGRLDNDTANIIVKKEDRSNMFAEQEPDLFSSTQNQLPRSKAHDCVKSNIFQHHIYSLNNCFNLSFCLHQHYNNIFHKYGDRKLYYQWEFGHTFYSIEWEMCANYGT